MAEACLFAYFCEVGSLSGNEKAPGKSGAF